METLLEKKHYLCGYYINNVYTTGHMTQEFLLQEMLSEMRSCIKKEDVLAGLPNDAGMTYDIEHIFILWQQFATNISNLKKYIAQLDDEIASRVPWGDICVKSEECFNDELPLTRFWTAPKDCFEENQVFWSEQYNAQKISDGDYLTYFVTSTDKDIEPMMEGAEEAKVCPSPASTLIMLQTRAKDSLKVELLKRTDFAVAHYREVELALGLKDTLPSTKRKRLLYKLKKIFRK